MKLFTKSIRATAAFEIGVPFQNLTGNPSLGG